MTVNTSSYSQYGQDLLVTKLLKEKRGGVFVEIGAFDGETFSNTALLERNYEWDGVCFEPMPLAFKKLRAVRKCICVQAAAGATTGKLMFECLDGEGDTAMLSGSAALRPAAHEARITAQQQAQALKRQTIEVDVVRAADVLRANEMRSIDFASIDVEGAELSCLQGLLDDDIRVSLIAIENNYAESETSEFLLNRDFIRLTVAGCDDIWRYKQDCGLSDWMLLALHARRRWRSDNKRRKYRKRLTA